MRAVVLMLVAGFMVAGCSETSQVPPVSSVRPLAPGAGNREPEPANSLPSGSATTSPFTPPAGNVGATRIGPR